MEVKKIGQVLYLLVCCMIISIIFACDGGPKDAYKHVIDKVGGAAFVSIADVDNDGNNDIIVSSFGSLLTMKGSVQIYYNKATGSLDKNNWQKEFLFTKSENVCFPNDVTVSDLDGDGDNDIIMPSGFLACSANPLVRTKWGLVWFEDTGNGWKRHDIVPYKRDHLFYHKAVLIDIDDDGFQDMVVVGEIANKNGAQYAKTFVFKGNNGPDRFEKTPELIGEGGGGLPVLYDVDDDGDMDILSAQYFAYKNDNTSFIWFENNEGSFTKHRINEIDAGPSIQLSVVENFYGDGVTRFVGSNHTNSSSDPQWPHEAVFSFETPSIFSDYWPMELISDEFQSRKNGMFGKHGAPGVFGSGDVDGDGDIDLIVSGDGDARIFFVRQDEPGVFETHVLDDNKVGQAGVAVGDLNNDGVDEIVVSTFDGNTVSVYGINKE